MILKKKYYKMLFNFKIKCVITIILFDKKKEEIEISDSRMFFFWKMIFAKRKKER